MHRFLDKGMSEACFFSPVLDSLQLKKKSSFMSEYSTLLGMFGILAQYIWELTFK